jgi:hypothetical protein
MAFAFAPIGWKSQIDLARASVRICWDLDPRSNLGVEMLTSKWNTLYLSWGPVQRNAQSRMIPPWWSRCAALLRSNHALCINEYGRVVWVRVRCLVQMCQSRVTTWTFQSSSYWADALYSSHYWTWAGPQARGVSGNHCTICANTRHPQLKRGIHPERDLKTQR